MKTLITTFFVLGAMASATAQNFMASDITILPVNPPNTSKEVELVIQPSLMNFPAYFRAVTLKSQLSDELQSQLKIITSADAQNPAALELPSNHLLSFTLPRKSFFNFLPEPIQIRIEADTTGQSFQERVDYELRQIQAQGLYPIYWESVPSIEPVNRAEFIDVWVISEKLHILPVGA